MPARASVPSLRDLPGAPFLGLLSLAIVVIVASAGLAWQSISTLARAAEARANLSIYAESIGELRSHVQETIVRGRGFAITGEASMLAAATAAGRQAHEASSRVIELGVAYAPPSRFLTLRAGVDSLSSRLLLLQTSGADGAAVARALVREGSGSALVELLLTELDGLAAEAAGRRAMLITDGDAARRRLALWLPLLAALALAVVVFVVLLLRAQARARARDLTRYRAIFDSTFQFIGLLKPDGTLIEANETALRFGGFPAEAVIGKPFWEARWWSANEATKTQLREAIARAAAGEFVRYDVEVVGADDRRAIIDFSLKPVYDFSGAIVYVVPEGRDVTDLHQAEAAARQLQQQMSAVLRHSPSLITVIDRDGRYLRASESIGAAIGKKVSEIVGRRIEEVLPEATVTTFRARLRQVEFTGAAVDVEDSFGPDDAPRRYRTVLFPMRSEAGEIFAIGTVAVNITEAHQARLKLEQALDENRVLQGLLSICAQCKRIHDKQDAQWKPVERYVQDHTAAVFSHGLCPSCTTAFIRESGLDSDE